MLRKVAGFTLIELLVVIAILGILTAIAVPSYRGYITTARANVAQNNLRNIYLKQQEYFTDNNVYYTVGASPCAVNNSAAINTALFAGDSVLDGTYYYYCITGTPASSFTAYATLISDTTKIYTITNTNTTNF
jgi:prepilin-type N-terminal cleavage/methylation domain-containing protein